MNNIQITSDIVTIDGIQYKRVIAEQKSEYPKILSFKNNDSIFNYKPSINTYKKEGDLISHSFEFMLKYADIHSVAKSETEVFTVGDKVECITNKRISFIIDRFLINAFTNNIMCEGKQISDGNIRHGLEFVYVEKAPERKPLFTTEDGKDIFEGDGFYEVFSKDMQLAKVHPECVLDFIAHKMQNYRKAFSTEEAAKAYIRDNKPEFSRKQIKEAIEKAGENFRNVCHKETIKDILGL